MIVARINDYEINDIEYKAELSKVLEKLRIEQPTREAKLRAIEQLIDGYLLLSKAREADIEVSRDEIDSKFIDFTLQFNSKDEYQINLKHLGLDESILRKRIEDELMIKKYIDQNFPPQEDIPIDKLKTVYLENKEAFITQEMVKASHILIKGNGNKIQQKVLKIKDEIRNPADFCQKARECSECPSCCKAGDLGYFPRGRMVREFEDAAFNLNLNEISEPIKTKFGYHLIMVTDYKKSKVASFDEVKDALKKRLQKIDSELRLIKYLKELRSKAEIEIYQDIS